MARTTALPSDLSTMRILGTLQAAELCNLSVTHWRRLYRSGAAPNPVKLGSRKLGWRVSDLTEWMATRGRPVNDNGF